jgi:hypothetical protein
VEDPAAEPGPTPGLEERRAKERTGAAWIAAAGLHTCWGVVGGYQGAEAWTRREAEPEVEVWQQAYICWMAGLRREERCTGMPCAA